MAKQITTQDNGPDIKTFRREVDEKLKDAEQLDKTNRLKQESLEKKIAGQEKKLADERQLLDKMKADYQALAGNRTAAAEAEESAGLKRLSEKLKQGGIDVSAFQAGKAELRRAKETKLAALKGELADSLKIIREKDSEVMGLECELLKMRQDFFYLEAAAPEIGLRDIEALLQRLSSRRQIATEGLLHIRGLLEKVETFIQRSKGRSMTAAEHIDNLDLAGVRALVFRSSIPAKYIPLLGPAVAEIEAHEKQRLERGQQPGRYRVNVLYAGPGGGPEGRIDWLCENPNSPEVVKPGLSMSGRKANPDSSISM